MTEAEKKMAKFTEGWNVHAKDMLMPAAKYDETTKKFISWEELVEPLSLFECKVRGELEGKIYAESVRGG